MHREIICLALESVACNATLGRKLASCKLSSELKMHTSLLQDQVIIHNALLPCAA